MITPEIGPRPVYLAGFDQNRKATAVHDDLWARAVAVSDGTQRIAIVSVDLIGVFHADVVKARERLQRSVPGAVLIVLSTHNHDGPDTMGLWGKGRFSSGVDRYLERVLSAIADTAALALGRLNPGRLVFGKSRTPGLIEDGRLPRVIDDTLLAMQVLDDDVSTDVETDGPIPGPHSMLSFASAAYRPDKTLVGTFSANLSLLPGAQGHPRTMQLWQRNPQAWNSARANPRDPAEVMPEYLLWVKQPAGRPVFVA